MFWRREIVFDVTAEQGIEFLRRVGGQNRPRRGKAHDSLARMGKRGKQLAGGLRIGARENLVIQQGFDAR